MRKWFLLIAILIAVVLPATTIQAQEVVSAKVFQSFTTEDWVVLPIYESGRGVTYTIDGESWSLPLETYMAQDTSAGRFGSKAPLQSSPDAGYCNIGQRDCTNHSLLYRVAVPRYAAESAIAMMDVAHRIIIQTDYPEPLPILIGLRWNLGEVTGDFEDGDPETNNWGLTPEELSKAFADLNLGNPALMVSSLEPVDGAQFFGQSLGEAVQIGYSCWDCLADTAGPQALAVPLTDVSHDGPSVAPLGETEIPGLSISLPNPAANLDWVMEQIVMTAPTPRDQLVKNGVVAWIGEFRPELALATVQGFGGGGESEQVIGNVEVVAARLNIRSAPSETAPIVDVVEVGLEAEVFEASGNFVRIGAGRWIMTGEGLSTFTRTLVIVPTMPAFTPTPEALG